VTDSRRDDDDREEDYGVAYNQDEKKSLKNEKQLYLLLAEVKKVKKEVLS
jgi:hypothetical protein